MVLRNVPQTDTFEQQRVELNELAVDVHNLKLQVDTFNLDDLVDVTASGAIINTDNSAFEKYKRSKLKFQNMEHELNYLKGEISEIKGLLKQLVQPT